MKKRLLRLCVPFIVATVIVGCGGDGPADPDPPAVEPPPNLSGTYDLQSLTQSGVTLVPPAATGTFTLTQTSSSGDTATGTLSLSVQVPVVGLIEDEGTFTVRTDGSWEQMGQQGQALGTFTLAGSVLTVMVTEPPAAVSTTVWRRR